MAAGNGSGIGNAKAVDEAIAAFNGDVMAAGCRHNIVVAAIFNAAAAAEHAEAATTAIANDNAMATAVAINIYNVDDMGNIMAKVA